MPPQRTIWSGSRVRVRIRIPDPDDFQNLTGTSLFKVTSVIKFSWKSDHSFGRYKPNCGTVPSSQCWRIFQQIPWSRSESGWP